jgi:hypothetical protein
VQPSDMRTLVRPGPDDRKAEMRWMASAPIKLGSIAGHGADEP